MIDNYEVDECEYFLSCELFPKDSLILFCNDEWKCLHPERANCYNDTKGNEIEMRQHLPK